MMVHDAEGGHLRDELLRLAIDFAGRTYLL